MNAPAMHEGQHAAPWSAQESGGESTARSAHDTAIALLREWAAVLEGVAVNSTTLVRVAPLRERTIRCLESTARRDTTPAPPPVSTPLEDDDATAARDEWGYWYQWTGEPARWIGVGTREEAQAAIERRSAAQTLRRGPVQRATEACPFGEEAQ